MLSSTKAIYKQLKPYLKKGYTFCPDTNFLMNVPDLFEHLDKETILVSKQVFNELDNLKKTSDNASPDQKRRSFEAREGLRVMDVSNSKIIDLPPAATYETYHLSSSPDEKIIANYLHYRDQTGENVIFLTFDRGAKLLAKSKGLNVIDFDLEAFQNKRRADQKQMNHKRKTQKLSGPRRVIRFINNVIKIGIGIIVLFIILGFFFSPTKTSVAEVDSVTLNEEITITPQLIYQSPLEDKFYIHYEIMNRQASSIYAFYNPDRPLELDTKPVEIGQRIKQMRKQTQYSNQLFLDQIYVKFKGREDEHVFATGSVEKVPTKQRHKGVIEVEGKLDDLIELQTSVFIVDTEERIPYTIKIKELKEMKYSDVKKIKKEL